MSSVSQESRILRSAPPSTVYTHPVRSTLRQSSACAVLRLSPRLQGQALAVRFASTAPGVQGTSVAENFAETIAPPPNEAPIDISDILASTSGSQIENHYGFLKELGLDFGWGPTALMEWALEHVHLGLGTPWWASIALTMLGIRVVLFKAYVGSADTSARLATIRPHIQGAQGRINAAKQAQDMPALMQGTQELRNIYMSADIKWWKNVLPFLQVPLGYGMFRLTRNMADLPVPGLEAGGALWFYDLTLSDPTYIMPLGTGIATFFMFKVCESPTSAIDIYADPMFHSLEARQARLPISVQRFGSCFNGAYPCSRLC